MNRRNVLLGLGAAAAGSGAIFGSGAFTQIDAERSVNIVVEGDSAAQLQLDAASGVSNIVNNDQSELSLDTGDGGGAGLNTDARIDIGNASTSTSLSTATSSTLDDFNSNAGPAFTVSSNTVREIDVVFDLSNIGGTTTELFLAIEDTNGPSNALAVASSSGGVSKNKILLENLGSNDTALDAAFIVDTDAPGVDNTEDLTGNNIIVTAEPTGEGGVTESPSSVDTIDTNRT